MNRRAWLTRVGQGIAGAAVLIHLPVEMLPQVLDIRGYAALNYMRREFNKAAEGMLGYHPNTIFVGTHLYAKAYEEMEAIDRLAGMSYYTLPNSFKFKGALCVCTTNPGWRVEGFYWDRETWAKVEGREF